MRSGSGSLLQIDRDVVGDPGITLRVLIELFLAPVAAEIIFLVLVDTGELCIVLVDDHQTYGIGCHQGFSFLPQDLFWIAYKGVVFMTGFLFPFPATRTSPVLREFI
jgi:hypothetical protein